MAFKDVKCSQLFAHHVEKKPRFLSDCQVTNQSITASALYLNHVTTIKSLFVETFLVLAWEDLFVVSKKEWG